MLSVSDAQELVLQFSNALPPRRVDLDPSCLDLVLAEDVSSDLDMPPFDKAVMDGYAVRAGDLPGGRGVLSVVEEITAGRTPTKTLGAGQAARIMTGAPIPAGADAVVVVEKSQPADPEPQIASQAPKGEHPVWQASQS